MYKCAYLFVINTVRGRVYLYIKFTVLSTGMYALQYMGYVLQYTVMYTVAHLYTCVGGVKQGPDVSISFSEIRKVVEKVD